MEKRRTEKASDHLIVGNFNSSDYINFYLDPDQEFEIASLNSDNELAKFMKAARSFKGSELSIFWACNHHPFAANEYARRFFPALSSKAIYFNSAFWNYNKQNVRRDTLRNIRMGADSIGSEIEYVSLLKAASSDVQIGEFINVHLRFTGLDVSGVLLVFALSDSSGNLLDWQGNKFSDFVLEEDENEVFSSYQLRQPTTEAAVLSIYIWNSERRNLLLNSVEIQSFKDSDYRFLY